MLHGLISGLFQDLHALTGIGGQDQSQLQLNRANRTLELSYRQIQSSKLAKEQAEESLRIRTERFKQGLEKTTDLLISEALSSQKKLEYIQAIYNYKQAIFEMELLLEKEI